MLWKHKKFYQEANEDIVDPPNETCVRLVSISGTYLMTGDRVVNISYIACGDETNTPIETEIAEGDTFEQAFNECIKEVSLIIDGVSIPPLTESITLADFDINIVWVVDCNSPCGITPDVASTIVSVVGEQNGVLGTQGYYYTITCVCNTNVFLQYTTDGVTWQTYQTLYLAGTTTITYFTYFAGVVGFRLISQCDSLPSNEFLFGCTQIYYQAAIPSGEDLSFEYVDCYGITQFAIFLWGEYDGYLCGTLLPDSVNAGAGASVTQLNTPC